MDDAKIKKSIEKFKGARSTLLVVALFTLVNVLLVAFESDWYLLFSATIPWYLMMMGIEEAAIYGYDTVTIFFMAAAFLGVFLYLLFWLLSKRFRVFILIAMLVFVADTVLFLVILLDLLLFGGFDFFLLIDLVFHIWITASLIAGTVAWGRLLGVPREQFEAANAEAGSTDENANSSELSSNDDNSNNSNDNEGGNK
ncbi:MAG: hypothetical protein FWC76_03690 [Defluviitaleaceae bacterium]|nr:hypothetical protein [Defluviitaleaceae bacterium]